MHPGVTSLSRCPCRYPNTVVISKSLAALGLCNLESPSFALRLANRLLWYFYRAMKRGTPLSSARIRLSRRYPKPVHPSRRKFNLDGTVSNATPTPDEPSSVKSNPKSYVTVTFQKGAVGLGK